MKPSKIRKIKCIIVLITLLSILCTNAFAKDSSNFSLWGSGEIFKCNPVLDGVIAGSGALLYGTDLLLEKGFKFNQKQFNGTLLDKNDVNAFDKFFMQPYSKPLDITSTVLVVTSLVSPAILAAATNTSEWMTIGIMYAESVLLSQGIKEFSKLLINRARPYMYFEGFPKKDVYDDLDWNNSCPSGHTTFSFMSATFFSYVFCKYNPASIWRYPVIVGSYALAATVAALRVASGSHFMTDVLFGAAIGTGIGFLVPYLHTLTTNKSYENKKGTQVAISPLGVNCIVRF